MDIRQGEHLPYQITLHVERQFQRENMDNHVLCLFLKGCFSASLAQAITSFLVGWLEGASEGLARRFRVGADAVVVGDAPRTERLMRILGVVGGRVAEGLVIPRLMMGLVFDCLVGLRVFNSHCCSPFS